MCGIGGCIGVGAPVSMERMELVHRALGRRGPDEQASWTRERTCLLHTRLSILDVECAQQPMTNEDGNVVVTFNGEIYNFSVLRERLLSRGHRFKSHGDTEVLVHLYEEQGADMVRELDGMFAFAIYDAREHSLLLARDHLGIKPLYYRFDEKTGELLFASNLAAMLEGSPGERRADPAAFAQFFQLGYVFHPNSWIQSTKQLLPGSTLTWKKGAVSTKRYYRWRYSPDHSLGEHDKAVQKLRELSSRSVADHLIADVPLGTLLSGGIDSTAITALAQQERSRTNNAIASFTMRFEGNGYDESSRARSIAQELKTQHNEVNYHDRRLSRAFIDDVVEQCGEPFGDASALAVYSLSLRVREHVKVVLSGDGGDELFLGYTGIQKQRKARQLRWIPAPVRTAGSALTAKATATLPRRAGKYFGLSLLDDRDLIFEWPSRWDRNMLQGLMTPELQEIWCDGLEDSREQFRDALGHDPEGGFAEQQIRFHMELDLPCDCLFKVDRMSMAHGLEVRVPMLSNSMMDFAGALPLDMRFHNGRSKEPLRSLAETLSVAAAEQVPKHGFHVPLRSWMGSDLLGLWREWDLTATLAKFGFRPDRLDAFLHWFDTRSHSGEFSVSRLSENLYDLLVLGIWLQQTGAYLR